MLGESMRVRQDEKHQDEKHQCDAIWRAGGLRSGRQLT